jgi:hypothetical protein
MKIGVHWDRSLFSRRTRIRSTMATMLCACAILVFWERLCASKPFRTVDPVFVWKFGCCTYLFQVVQEASDRFMGMTQSLVDPCTAISKKEEVVLTAVCYLDATPLLVLLQGFLGSRKGVKKRSEITVPVALILEFSTNIWVFGTTTVEGRRKWRELCMRKLLRQCFARELCRGYHVPYAEAGEKDYRDFKRQSNMQ